MMDFINVQNKQITDQQDIFYHKCKTYKKVLSIV